MPQRTGDGAAVLLQLFIHSIVCITCRSHDKSRLLQGFFFFFFFGSASGPSQGEQQEAREDAEVPRVVVEPVAGRQAEADSVARLQLQRHGAAGGGVAAVVVQLQAEEDGLLVPVQVQTRVALQVVRGREAEEVEASDGGRENT